jgi:transcriptional regulator with XRE-family HTH domain
MRLRNRLQGARGRNGHSLRDVATIIHVKAGALSDVERGVRILSPRLACALAPYLKTAPLRLLHDDAADRLDRYLALDPGPEGGFPVAPPDAKDGET